MRVDIAVARYRGVDDSGVLHLAGPGWLVAGIVDGAGSWGAGMEAATWTRRHLAERWATLERPAADEIVAGIQAVVAGIPVELSEDEHELGCAFSIALMLARGAECHAIAAGAYGIEMIRGGTSTPLFTPRRWVDEQVDKGLLTKEQAAAHPLHRVLTGPFVADGRPVAPLTPVPFRLEPRSSVLIAEFRPLERLRPLVAQGTAPLTAEGVQALAERPAMPVVIIEA